MAEKKKLPAASGTGTRPSRLNKINTKMQRASALGDVSKAVFSVRLIQQNAPVEIAGNILKMAADAVTVQYFRSGSSKELIAIIPASDIISVIGGEGKPSIVTYIGDSVILAVKQAYVQVKEKSSSGRTQYLVKDIATGDVILMNVGQSQRVEIVGEASSVAEGGAKKPKKFKK